MASLGNELGNPLGNVLGNPLSGGVGASYQAILGPLLVEMWHSQLGIATVSGNVDTWTGQIGGRVLAAAAAINRPAYAVDGSVFGAKPVVQTSLASLTYLRVNGLTPALFASGTKPWVYSVARFRVANPGLFSHLYSASGGSDHNYIRISNGNNVQGGSSSGGLVTDGAADTVRHGFQTFLDGTKINLVIDGTVTQAAVAGSTTADATRFSVGCAGADGIFVSTASIALIVCCTAKPNAAQIAAISALASAEFPA